MIIVSKTDYNWLSSFRVLEQKKGKSESDNTTGEKLNIQVMAVGHDELKSGKAMPKAKKNDLYFSLELNTA